MIWLTWRQFRGQAWVASATLVVMAVALTLTGLHLGHMFGISGIATCHTRGDCASVSTTFINQVQANSTYKVFNTGMVILYGAPALIGIFWGAPLVSREFEAGTFRLAWNQSVTRTRWLAAKLALLGLAAIVTTGLLSLMLSWWASPIYRAAALADGSNGGAGPNHLDPLLFGASGIAPVGYAAFAFALGVTLGALIRRTIPAMAATLAVFAAALLTMSLWIRPRLVTPAHMISALNPANIDGVNIQAGGRMLLTAAVSKPSGLVVSSQIIDTSGRVFTGPPTQACESATASFQACSASIARLNLRQLVSYQPASRYWMFQWYETAIFLGLGLALAAFCFWWIGRRRLS